ncbi:3D domain-containing protein [Oscillospiraceae bacterium 50-58]
MISTNEGRGGVAPRVLPNRRALRRSLDAWKRAAIGLLVLAVLCNVAQALVHTCLWGQLEQELQMAEESRDNALQELAAVSLATAQEKQARAAQAAEYEAVGAWEYIGECRLTAYCCEPYAHICGTGDGLTATGIPVTPGIAAVDPAVIPLGSTLIIDGQRYLAADVGGAVAGQTVDIAVATHQEAVKFGVQRAPVWIVKEAQ